MMGWYWGGRGGRGVQWGYWIFQTDYVDEGWACDAALSLYDAVASIPAAVSTPANYKVNRSRWIVWVGSKVAYERVVGLFGSWVGLGGPIEVFTTYSSLGHACRCYSRGWL